MSVILQTWSQLQRTSSSFGYVNSGAARIQCIYSSAYSILNIRLNVSALLLEICRYLHACYTANFVQVQSLSSDLRYVNCGPGHIQYIYSSAHSDFNIHLNVSALQLEISRQFNARYTANLVPNTAHILRFTLCELWSRTYTIHLQHHTFRLQYSSERICAAIGNISTIQCSLYCKLGAKYSAHPPVYAMWTMVPDIYNVVTDLHVQASIFN
jgi:hypothetical protein